MSLAPLNARKGARRDCAVKSKTSWKIARPGRGCAARPWPQPYVAAIIKVERIVLSFQPATGLWKRSQEVALYLSSHPIKAADAARVIRGHWDIENRLHYVRDVTLREDASQIRKNPAIFATIRSFAYNILRFNLAGSFAQTRYAAALGGLKSLAALRLCQEN